MNTQRAARRHGLSLLLLGSLLATLTLSAGGCQLPLRPRRPSASAGTTAPTTVTSPTPSASPTESAANSPDAPVQKLLQRIDGVSDPYTITDPVDLDCEPGNDTASKLDVRFTAADAKAMRAALLAGRTYVRDQGESGYLCLIGSYPGDRRTVQVDLTNDFAQADGTWPSASMITALVKSSRQNLKVGATPLRWTATADTDSALEFGVDLDRHAPKDPQAIDVFAQLQQHWTPLKGYDSVTISVPTKSGGFLSTTQQDGPITPWKATIPDGMIDIFRSHLTDLGDVDLSRIVTAGEVDDQFDFLYADHSSMSWSRRQTIAHEVLDDYEKLPADQRDHPFGIRSGEHTELDFNTTSCNGVLPGMNHRQDAPQTRALYRWYAKHYPKQAEKGGVDHCLGKHI